LKNNPDRKSAPAGPEPEATPLRKSERTRASILQAARTLFAERGYDGTTVRDVAACAGVDPALVIRYFGNKEELFVRAAEFELQLPDIAAMKGGRQGEVLVRHFFEIWERGPSATAMTILLRSAITNEAAAEKMRAMFTQQVLPAVARNGPRGTAPMRAGLVATQLLGMALCRYVLKIPGVVMAEPEELVAALAPTIQSYLSGKS
jgi:AcrR family transcriptional regulator